MNLFKNKMKNNNYKIKLKILKINNMILKINQILKIEKIKICKILLMIKMNK